MIIEPGVDRRPKINDLERQNLKSDSLLRFSELGVFCSMSSEIEARTRTQDGQGNFDLPINSFGGVGQFPTQKTAIFGKFHGPRKVDNSFLGRASAYRHCSLCSSLISDWGSLGYLTASGCFQQRIEPRL